ncbi:MAG TPA: glycosyltransferase [Xanthobacteraceae bacterium]|nr:glycosyltransferase [Xanthobacteraceae bacterium]
MPDDVISVMLTNAVIPPATAERIKQWDGETDRDQDLIVCVGRLSPEKDQRTLIRAMTMLPPGLPWRLAIVGDGTERPALEALVRELGLNDRVVFTGQVSDPFAWMRRASPSALRSTRACATPSSRRARLRHAGGVDELSLWPVRNLAGRALWRTDAGRRTVQTLRRTLHRTLHPDSCRPLWPKCGQSFAATRVAYG